jgi:hypothetical protein
MRRARLGFALGLVLWSRAGFALDAKPRVALELKRGEGTDKCIQSAAVEHAVERRLRRPVFASKDAADLGIEVALAREPDGAWSAKLVLRGRDGSEIGSRELDTHASHCSSLDDALVLVVALLVDSPEARAQTSKAAAVPPTSATPSPAEAPKPPPNPSPPNAPQVGSRIELPPDTYAPREPYRVEVAASVVGSMGAVPDIALGGELLLGVRPPHFIELRVRPTGLLPKTEAAPTSDRGGRFSLLTVALDACPLEHEVQKLRFVGCVAQRVGRMHAEGFGFHQSASSSELYYALGISAGAAFWFAPPVGVRVGLDVEAPLTRDAYFSVGAAGERREIFRPSPVVGAATVGLALSL